MPPESERKKREGRVKTLSRLSEGWQERVYDELSEKWKPAFAVMAVTGCRPAELNGLEIFPTEKEGVLRFRIAGKKVTEKAGQGWRELTIDVRDAVGAADLLQEIGADGGRIEMLDSPQAITKAMTRAAQRAEVVRLDQTLPGYACRNAVASRMKAEGFSLQEVAGALGHSTDECQKFYGRASAGHKGGGGRVLGIETARQVRETGRTRDFQPRPSVDYSR